MAENHVAGSVANPSASVPQQAGGNGVVSTEAELPNYTGQPADWSLIPSRMVGGLRRYIEHGIEPGSFLTAVICNDLREAFGCADDENRQCIGDYVQFFYNYAPSQCWGSPANYLDWIARGGLKRSASC